MSGDYRHSGLGIESVDGRSNPVHDDTDQYQGFAYVDHILDDQNRVSFVGGYSNQWFQIPNPVGQQPSAGWSVGGQTAFPSEKLNETQLEKTGFGQVAFLHDAEPLTVQARSSRAIPRCAIAPTFWASCSITGRRSRRTSRTSRSADRSMRSIMSAMPTRCAAACW